MSLFLSFFLDISFCVFCLFIYIVYICHNVSYFLSFFSLFLCFFVVLFSLDIQIVDPSILFILHLFL